MAAISLILHEGLLLFSLLVFANAQNVCQDGARAIIGSDNCMQYEAEDSGGRLYLNVDNPAQCSGTITQLEYCYYPPARRPLPPDNRLPRNYLVYFAIYRQGFDMLGNAQYQKRVALALSGPVNTLDEEFSCTSFNIPRIITRRVPIQEGDIIGACLPRTISLDILGDIESDEEGLNTNLSYIESNCGILVIPPTVINKDDTRVQERGILHLYARITPTNNRDNNPITNSEPEPRPPTATTAPEQPQTESGGDISPNTNSESQPPTVPTVPDHPQTDSDSNISMSTPSHFSSTSYFIGGQPSTSMAVPIAITSTGTITNIQSATGTYVENSASEHTPVTSIVLMTSAIDNLLIVTSNREPDLMTTSLATTPSGSPNLKQKSFNTAAAVIIILTVIAFMVLTAALVGILARKYRKRRFRFYPAFKHTILEEDENVYSQAGTIARFDNVLYSNYTETVQIQDARKTDQVYDYCDSSQKSSVQRPIESMYSELQEEMDSESYSYAVISGKYDALTDSRLPEQRPYDPDRESLLSTYYAPASKESDLYDQLKLCGVKNIRHDTIEATEHLGSGQFGDVKKGIWRNEKLKVPVALKTLKEGSEQVDKVKFLQEAAIMAQFSHPNVALLYGVVSKGEPIMLVVELVEKGNLFNYLTFLKENNDSVHLPNLPNILLNFSRQVALGMCYLSERGFVHRDLAARNILVSSDNTCKIADFGMSRDLADEDYYVSHGGKIPVKWTAPEAINYKKYSTASDVWSYGCLLYEVWSLGHKPYENLSNLQAIRLLELGQRLPPPPGCPRKIYELMIFCWNPEVAFRPKFSSLALILIGDWKEVLAIPQEDLVTHQLAGVLGAPLEAGEGMYLDLQNRYVFN